MKIRSVSYNRKTGEFEYGMLHDGHHAYPLGYSKERMIITEKEFFIHYNEEAELDIFPEEENEKVFTREEIATFLIDNYILPHYSHMLEKLTREISKIANCRNTVGIN